MGLGMEFGARKIRRSSSSSQYWLVFVALGFFGVLFIMNIVFHIELSIVKKQHVHKSAGVKTVSNSYDPNFNNFAVALKTGKDVALTRTPIQILTYLSKLKNMIIIGEAPHVFVGNHEMVDVYTHLYDNLTETKTSKRHVRDSLQKRTSTNSKSESKPDENSLGWKSDAHKNLPGFRELYARFPEAEWFLMLDDDTFVFFDNLKELLSAYNPDEPHYMGSNNMFVGCDGVSKWGQGPGFAHGGSGIVVSRGALKKMLSSVDTCIIKYKDCWAGDIRTALCLRDHGILVKDPGGFNGNPPHEEYWFNRPCQKPITFHHLLVSQIQKLYNLDVRKKSVTMADVYDDWHPQQPIEKDMDRPGGDLSHESNMTAEQCHQACLKNSKCVSFSHSGSECWLKREIPPAKKKQGFTSGVVNSHFTC